MPDWLRPHSTGTTGSSRNCCISFVVGIARELEALRENIRWVLNSDRTNRGNRSTNVVRRCPVGLTLSSRTSA